MQKRKSRKNDRMNKQTVKEGKGHFSKKFEKRKRKEIN